ncbi:MAG: hypothetical protein DHS20C20_07450 [Ardenticatenaceae bacterium]|nr:MAG: hypothetical protein DHS20C20_07450 [Ardenticatenaceae bacterium]
MIFNKDLLFIHIGKTGGMSCSHYLLQNLQRPVYNCHYEAKNEAKKLKLDGIIPMPDIFRHCTLAEALDYIKQLNGMQLNDFAKVVAVIRHPFTLEYSFYKHLQKPKVRERRKNKPRLLELADGDFKTFVAEAEYHRKGHTQDDFVRLGNEIPSSVELVKFEQLISAFPAAVSPFTKKTGLHPFPHHNRTDYHSEIHKELTSAVIEAIYQKHRFMFDSGLYSITDLPAKNYANLNSKKRRPLLPSISLPIKRGIKAAYTKFRITDNDK